MERREAFEMVSRTRLRELARYSLYIWGETAVCRMPDVRPRLGQSGYNAFEPEPEEPPKYEPPMLGETQTMYPRGVGKGVYRPIDDPNPAAFLYLQVERALDELRKECGSDIHRLYAAHRYAFRRAPERFAESKALNEALMGILVDHLSTDEPETVVDSNLVEIRMYLMARQRERQAERQREYLERREAS